MSAASRARFAAAMACLILASAAPASAQNALAQPVWDVQIQGGFLWRHQFTAPAAAERVNIGGDAFAAGTETIAARDNWTGRLAARLRWDGGIDFGLAYTGIGSATNRRTFISEIPVVLVLPGLITVPVVTAAGGLELRARTKATQHIADFDAGMDLGAVGPGTLKLLGGLRFTHFSQTTHLSVADALFPAPGEFTHRRRDEFIGAGPRFGAQWSQALWDGFSFNAGVAGSILFGQQRISTSTSGLGGVAAGALEETHGRVAYNGEGEVSVAYAWSSGVYASIGYQAAAWFGLRDNRRELDAAATLAAGSNPAVFVGGGRRYPIDLTHGPFLRLGFRW